MLKIIPTVRILGSDYKSQEVKNPRLLCLHGFRTSGEILKKQINKWPECVRQKLDLVFVDGPCPAQGKSHVESLFDPPYYEWFQYLKDGQDYIIDTNFEKCLEYIQECMTQHGPFDGLLGFSQGAALSATLPGLQAKGVALTKVPRIKFLVIIGGAKLTGEPWAENAYATPIECPSIHFLGKRDNLRPSGEELLKCATEPFVIHHPKGHVVPPLDNQSLPTMLKFIDKIQKIISEEGNESNGISDHTRNP